MLEATIPCEDEQRMLFDKQHMWQVRNARAGLKQLPLDQKLLKNVKTMLKVMGYHNDFRIDEDGPLDAAGMERKNPRGSFFWKPT
ncbi:hypothetical protein M0R45_017216 [Rubus argutus]|uniref:Uncharacterized protein n=1 Tax=Rubus argutus TaxID=59490 RepID=A0AAW1XYE4_RUBAR